MGELETERATVARLLLNVLPQPIIDRLNAGERLIADRYDDVAIVFSDFVGFTEISARLPVTTLVSSLNGMFSAFDAACQALGVEKIKTIGDAYMAAAGLPGTSGDPVAAAADLALAMRAAVRDARAALAGSHRSPPGTGRGRRHRHAASSSTTCGATRSTWPAAWRPPLRPARIQVSEEVADRIG